MVDGTADLVEYGHDTLLKCIGRGESDSLEHVGGHVDARCTLRASGLGGLERGDGGADLRLIAVVLGRGAGITGYNCRQLERFRAPLVRRQNGLLQCFAGGSAHLVHSGEAHAAALIERHIKARCLKGRGAHAAHMLNQVCRLDGAGLGGLDGEAVAVAVSAGLSEQVSVTVNGSPRRATTDTSTARRRSTSRLSAAPAASMAR